MEPGTLAAVAEETPEQAAVRRRLRRHAAARKRSAEKEVELIREAISQNIRYVDIAADLERSREHLRLVLNPEKRK